MTRHLFLINPTARGAAALAAEAEAVCARSGHPCETVTTARAGEMAELTRQAGLSGEERRIFVLGGDGSLNEAVRGAAGFPNLSLTAVPCGTGNDFVRTFGGKDSFLDFERLFPGREAALDLIEVSVDGGPPSHAVNICSVGTDADVAAGVTRHKWARRFGSKMPYNISVVLALLRGANRPYSVTVDGERLDGRFTMLTCCNGQTYGGGFRACPDADPADGVLEFLLVRGMGRLAMARIVGKFGKGKYKELSRDIRHIRGQSMTIEAQKPFFANYDGECVPARRVMFSLSPYKLRFILPGESIPFVPFAERYGHKNG